MEDVKAFRILSYATEPPIHVMSVVSNGDMAVVVHPDHVESSEDPGSRVYRQAEMVGKPTTTAGWANLIGASGSYYSISLAPGAAGDTFESLVAQEQEAIGQEDTNDGVSEGTLPFNDSVDEMFGLDPEVSDFLSSGEAAAEPGGMREYVKFILKSNNALALNPALSDWLAGGPAPTDDTFDGIIWSAE